MNLRARTTLGRIADAVQELERRTKKRPTQLVGTHEFFEELEKMLPEPWLQVGEEKKPIERVFGLLIIRDARVTTPEVRAMNEKGVLDVERLPEIDSSEG